MSFNDLEVGQQVSGIIPNEDVTIVSLTLHGEDAMHLVYRRESGDLAEVVLYRDRNHVEIVTHKVRPYDAPGDEFRLAAEARRIQLAAEFDPMVAVHTSAVDPLPHQIRAVYDVLLRQVPLRFLLADDPGAGKTIMAGLYLKEMLLREDAKRILIVVPGGLVDQWRVELLEKFTLDFRILSTELIAAAGEQNVFEEHPLMIARMDQLARNDALRELVEESFWDVVVVDEAHRMAAQFFGEKLHKTRRYQLGELLSRRTRHLLLMTATPHAGSHESFQLFLRLLDPERFAGRFRQGAHSPETTGFMRRMVKEDLLTFEGKPLFPERRAETVPYSLSEAEKVLYEQVTSYVRHEMNRAERLDNQRRNTVGFALMVLQRRVASSPEAIYQSLRRRVERLETYRLEVLAGAHPQWKVELDRDEEDYTAEEFEVLEEQLIGSATTSVTVDELDAEIASLEELVEQARHVRNLGEDRKWNELRRILQSTVLHRDDGTRRKLIIFTEHRDTLEYLQRHIATVLGDPDAIVTIHGGVSRSQRVARTQEFTHNPECQVLIATDAAGEGLNLHAAHLMVNYDLPWNPNRIEQRFGRIHRIGQTEVCRLWNLVAVDTREGQVLNRLLDKIAQQDEAYQGKLFDVLGQTFYEQDLRQLFLEAIRYGDLEHVRERAQEVVDPGVSRGLKEVMKEQALVTSPVAEKDLDHLRKRMEAAQARRLQPHFIEYAFRAAFTRLGGRISQRETGRFEITSVPPRLRLASHKPIARRYQRVTFDLQYIEPDEQSRVKQTAELLAPGHPLHDEVFNEVMRKWGDTLNRGAVVVGVQNEEPGLVLGLRQEVVDGTQTTISRRFGYAAVRADGTVSDAGMAPHLDTKPLDAELVAEALEEFGFLIEREGQAVSWFVQHRLPEFLQEISDQRIPELTRLYQGIEHRLNQEIQRLALDQIAAIEKQRGGEITREDPDVLARRGEELTVRKTRRLNELAQQKVLNTLPLRVDSAALVLPASWLSTRSGGDTSWSKETEEIERRAVELVMAVERRLGREPVEMPYGNKGYDIASQAPDGSTYWIEVKGRIEGKRSFDVSISQVLSGKNRRDKYILAVVKVDPRGPEHDELRYIVDPFPDIELGNSGVESLRLAWKRFWDRGVDPA